MPKYSGKKSFHQEIVNRHAGEIRNLLHALELRDDSEEGENRPATDMFETAGEVVVEFDLPGFRVEDIALALRGTSLVLEAQRPRDQVESSSRFVCLERGFGRFRHSVQIPCCIDQQRVRAEYRKGVLRVVCIKTGDLQVPIKEIID